jgi:hypothetical protein
MNSRRIFITICALLAGISSRAMGAGDTATVPTTARLVITCDLDSSIVFLDGSIAGITPITLDSVVSGNHHLLVRSKNSGSWYRKADSANVFLMPGETRELRFSVLLPFKFEPGYKDGFPPIVLRKNGNNGRTIGIWASGGAAVVAGIAAAYLKITADDRNETYLKSGNSAVLDERKKLDFAAGVALIATQLGFMLFAYFLLGE